MKKELRHLLLLFFSFIMVIPLSANQANSQDPVISFSDLTAAPNSGWSQENPQKGAVVTVWGRNFGDSRGNSYVTVNGVDLINDSDYAETWGETNKPVPFLQRISFWLNDTIPSGEGNITITVDGKKSAPIDFRVGEGNIYFVDVKAQKDKGSGTLTDPWQNLSKFVSTMKPGDIAYFREGVYYKRYTYGKSNIWLKSSATAGTKEQPIAFVGYPGERAVFDSMIEGDRSNFNKSIKIEVPHITVAKLATNAYGSALQMSAYGRAVGNDFVGVQKFVYGTGIIYTGRDGAKILGNALHGGRSENRLDHAVYIGGCNPVEGAEVAYNYSYDNSFDRGPHIVANHQEDRCPSDVALQSHFIYNNLVDCSDYQSRAIGVFDLSWDQGEAQEPKPTYVFNNITNACGHGGYGAMYHNNGHAEFYNNTNYDSKGPSLAVSGSQVLSTTAVNNIFYQRSNNTKYVSQNITKESNNLYFKGDNTSISPNATHTITDDPLFHLDTVNFEVVLNSNSPAVDKGDALVSTVVKDDFLLTPRGSTYHIGAMQLTDPTNPVEPIVIDPDPDPVDPDPDPNPIDPDPDPNPIDPDPDPNPIDPDPTPVEPKPGDPVISFSDLTAAPNNGWSQENPEKGAVVTVWGRNFGNSRGNSYVTVNGVDLINDSDYAETWGQTNKPVPFLQRISFWLNDTIPLGKGTISITVDGKKSAPIDFRVGKGNIYFVDVKAQKDKGSGTLTDPWQNLSKFVSIMKPGDIAYFREGVYNKRYTYGKSNIWVKKTGTSGTKEQPIAFVGYPGEKAVFDSLTHGDKVNFNKSIKIETAYITVAKLWANAYGSALEMSTYGRAVGNDFIGVQKFVQGTGIIYTGRDGAKVLGNALHGGRSENRLDHAIYIGGCNPVEGAEVAYNYSYDNSFDRGPHIVANHQVNRCPSDVALQSHFIYNNLVDCSTYKSRAIGVFDLSWDEGEAQEPKPTYVFNNITNACGHGGYGAMYHNNGHAEFYNNTNYDSQGPSLVVSGGQVLSSKVMNNIFYQRTNDTKYLSGSALQKVTAESNNLYFNGDNNSISPNASHSVTEDPLFYLDLINFNITLDSNSPAIKKGASSISNIVKDDFLLTPRGNEYNIGAVQ